MILIENLKRSKEERYLLETISNYAVAICLSRYELMSRGYGESISEKAAMDLVRQTLISRGEDPWQNMEVDLFANGDEMLLMARPVSLSVYCFIFRDFESLITAIGSFGESPPSFVTYMEGSYYLLMRMKEGAIPMAMYEYGQSFACSDLLAVHITEHGHLIAAGDAVSMIRQKFVR